MVVRYFFERLLNWLNRRRITRFLVKDAFSQSLFLWDSFSCHALSAIRSSRLSYLSLSLLFSVHLRESIYITRADSIYRSYNVFHSRIPFVSPVRALIIPRTLVSLSLFLLNLFSLATAREWIASSRRRLLAIRFLSRVVIISREIAIVIDLRDARLQ